MLDNFPELWLYVLERMKRDGISPNWKSLIRTLADVTGYEVGWLRDRNEICKNIYDYICANCHLVKAWIL